MSTDERRKQQIENARTYVAETHQKMSQIVQEFASGELNRTQFHRLYDRYQRQIMTIEQYITESDPTGWKDAIKEEGVDSTLHLRKSLAAKAIGISVYDNRSGMPIETVGEFRIDAELIVPMLSSYRSAASEIFHSGMRSTAMENGNWLCFVPGQYSTLIVLFSVEPSSNQMEMIERMHRDFEIANADFLENGYASPDQLAYPFYSFLNQTNLGDRKKFADTD
jgi:hypothetical protein